MVEWIYTRLGKDKNHAKLEDIVTELLNDNLADDIGGSGKSLSIKTFSNSIILRSRLRQHDLSHHHLQVSDDSMSDKRPQHR